MQASLLPKRRRTGRGRYVRSAMPRSLANACSSGPTSTCRSRTGASPTTRGSAPRCRRLKLLRDSGAASITVCSHLGRPQATIPASRWSRSRARLRELSSGPLTRSRTRASIRGETNNDPAFAQTLADGKISSSRTPSARSTAPTPRPSACRPTASDLRGLAARSELEHLGRLLGEVERPFVLVCGGAKVDDKLGVLRHLGGRADTVLVGGKMAEQLRVANPLQFPVELPVDVVGAASLRGGRRRRESARSTKLPYALVGLDIGPATRIRFAEILGDARTIFWNGPMGVFEWPAVRRRDERSPRRSRSRRLLGRRRSRLAARAQRARPHRAGRHGHRQAAAPHSSCSKARSSPGVAVIPSARRSS